MAAPSTSHRRLAKVPRSRSSSRRPCARRRRSGKGLLAPCSFPCLGGDCRAGLAQDFGVFVFSVLVLVLFAPPAVQAGSPVFRIDPEALSGRIAQYLLGEPEAQAGLTAAASFGTNIQISDEHIPGRLISQTEPTIAVNPANDQNLVAGFHDLFPKTQDFVCRVAFTMDGGSTWNLGGATPLENSGDFCSDPAIAADAGA